MKAEWRARLRLAARLGVAPREFWRLSVAEWRALTEAAPEHAAMDRAALAGLIANYPDTANG